MRPRSIGFGTDGYLPAGCPPSLYMATDSVRPGEARVAVALRFGSAFAASYQAEKPNVSKLARQAAPSAMAAARVAGNPFQRVARSCPTRRARGGKQGRT